MNILLELKPASLHRNPPPGPLVTFHTFARPVFSLLEMLSIVVGLIGAFLL